MNEQERALTALGIEALNASLRGLGYPTLASNPDVRLAEPIVGDNPNAVVDSPNVAPLRIVFGRDLDIWVGPYSGVVTIPASDSTRGKMEEMITKVLMSEVICRHRKRSVELVLRLPDEPPWLTLRVAGTNQRWSLNEHYQPYASMT